MARLNHGTLLENIVVLEATRLVAAEVKTLEFAHAFSMPPLTEGWHNSETEPRNNPRFKIHVLEDLLDDDGAAPGSYAWFLRLCLQNAPQLAIVPYAGQPVFARGLCGPNGALLAALVARTHGKSPRIWSNDLANDGRYHSPDHDSASECPHTNSHACQLLGLPGPNQPDAFCGVAFPGSIQQFAAWRQPCDARIGFLDPDSYGDGGAQVNSASHAQWLYQLVLDASSALGIMFFAHRIAPHRPHLVAQFHQDAVDQFPESRVFRLGNHMVGVKFHHADGARNQQVAAALHQSINAAWTQWCARLDRQIPLGVSVNGVYA